MAYEVPPEGEHTSTIPIKRLHNADRSAAGEVYQGSALGRARGTLFTESKKLYGSMKPGPNSKRSRGRGNPRRPHNSGNNPRNQVYESNGPEVRIRGTVNQVLEKYLALARDASSSGDYVAAENFFQHAEHYFRILSANGGFHNGLQRIRPGVPQGQPGQPGQPRPSEQPQGQPGGAQAQMPPAGGGNGAGEAAAMPAPASAGELGQPDPNTGEN